jgi:hypothetical protein
MELDPQSVSSIIHAKTTNDPNGNPRRCFVLLNGLGQTLAVVDEGFLGLTAWHGVIRKDPSGSPMIGWVEPEPFELEVTPKAYNRLIQG